MTSIQSVNSQPSTINSFAYTYNNANQRTRASREDGSFWIYKYDSLGQVISGKKYWSDFTPVAGQQFEYAFDDIGNRTTTQAGGDETGANLRLTYYLPNNLNQNTLSTVPSAFDVIGVGFSTNSVTVNGDSTYRHGEYFRKEITVDNNLVPVWQPVTVASPGQTSVTGHEFIPKTAEIFRYDLDGNLTNDGRWTYYWDAENRLVKMAAHTSVGPQISLQFEYDSKSRRIRKKVFSDTGWSTYTNDLQFIYDGWNLIAELSNSHSALRTYTWGLDLSGSVQDAGGVGGLVAIQDATQGAQFVSFDGSGNVVGLSKATDGSRSATYEYNPFGELVRTSGSIAKPNPFRWSTRYQDDETDLVMYPCRPYRDGHFLSRDPLEEAGGVNLYGFVNNNPVNATDPFGLVIETSCDPIDDYLNSLGISFRRTGSYRYTLSGGDLGAGDASAKMIVSRMLFTKHVFKISSGGGSAAANLVRHVDARLTIVRNALRANFQFGEGRLTSEQIQQFHANPQRFFDDINGTGQRLACRAVTTIIFESGNNWATRENRHYDFVWIPGDWGYIRNLAWERDPTAWGPGSLYKGENVIHTGSAGYAGLEEMFWGHFDSGVHPSISEDDWFYNIRYKWKGGLGGDPRWKKLIVGPGVGLDSNSETVPEDN